MYVQCTTSSTLNSWARDNNTCTYTHTVHLIKKLMFYPRVWVRICATVWACYRYCYIRPYILLFDRRWWYCIRFTFRGFCGSAAIHERLIHKNLDQSGNESAFDDCVTKYKMGTILWANWYVAKNLHRSNWLHKYDSSGHVWVWAYYGYGYSRMCRRRCQLFYEMYRVYIMPWLLTHARTHTAPQ